MVAQKTSLKSISVLLLFRFYFHYQRWITIAMWAHICLFYEQILAKPNICIRTWVSNYKQENSGM